MPLLQKLCLESGSMTVTAPVQTKGKPGVKIRRVEDQYRVTFKLKTLVPGQTFLGLYPLAATLPAAEGLTIGDYALLASGEILQIG